MSNDRMLQVLRLCKRLAAFDEDYIEDLDTYAVGSLDALTCVLDDAICEIEEDIREHEESLERWRKQQAEQMNMEEDCDV